MDKKFLTSKPWAELAKKHGITAPNLAKALTAYEKVANVYGKEPLVERLKQLDVIMKCAVDLKKFPEVAKLKDVIKYLDEMYKTADADKKYVKEYQADAAEKEAAEKKAKEAAKPKPPPKPDSEMLLEAMDLGVADGFDNLPTRRSLFAKAKPFQDKYDSGYKNGQEIKARGPQTSMKKISKEDWDKSVKYTQRKKLRKEFIKYLNEQWSTVLPEDM